MLKAELKKIWQNKMLLITVIAVCFIPILYAGFFLKSVWDPYSNLGNVPVAVVNEDKPVNYNGQALNVGQEVVDTLKKDDSFKWNFVSKADAEQGMKDNKYYMVVTLPSDFSAKAATVTSVDPEKMDLKFETNGSLNFPIQTISESGITQLKAQITKSVTLAYSNAIIATIKDTGNQIQTAADGAKTLHDGLATADAGAQQLDSGAKSLNSGTNQLNTGVGQLASQTPTLVNGVGQLASGAQQLDNGVNQLVSQTKTSGTTIKNSLPQVAQLNNGTHQLASGLGQITSSDNQAKISRLNTAIDTFDDEINFASEVTSSQEYANLINNLAKLDKTELEKLGLDKSTATQLANNLDTIRHKMQVAQNIPNASTLKNELASLTNGLAQLASGSQQVAAGTDQLYNQLSAMSNQLNSATTNAQLDQLASGSKQLASGLNQLNSNMPTLSSGIRQLQSGSKQLANGSKQLVSGTTELTGGTKQLVSGSGELADKLQQGADTAKATPLSNKTAEQIAEPVRTSESKHSDVTNYGHGLAPYFMSVSLFVGCIMFNFAYPIRKIADKKGSWFGWYGSKVILGGVVAVVMALIVGGVMMMLGLHPQNVGQYYGVLIIYALAMMYLVMFLAITFDNPGRFVAMIILILSLSASGGTFPVETSNGFYQTMHNFVPITYSIEGLKQTISGGISDGMYSKSLVVITSIAIVSLILLAISMYIMKKRHGNQAGASRLDNNQQTLSDDYSNYRMKRA